MEALPGAQWSTTARSQRGRTPSPGVTQSDEMGGSALTPGTSATVTSSILVIVGPAPRCTVADVSMVAGGWPALVSWAARNIEKQPACAAPISSSGLVPLAAPSNLDTNVKGALKNPESPFIVPAPSLSVPVHVA